MVLLAWTPVTDVFEHSVDLLRPEPSLRAERVLAHAQSSADEPVVGQLEALGGWDRVKGSSLEQLAAGPLWAPGSSVMDPETSWFIKENGLWQLKAGG